MRIFQSEFSALWGGVIAILLVACSPDSGVDGVTVADTGMPRVIGDTGGVTDMRSVDMGSADMGPLVADMGETQPNCESSIGYGLIDSLMEFTDQMSHSPRAVWNGTEWGVVWITGGADDEPSTVWFQRVSGHGEGVSSPAEIGRTRSAQLAVVHTGDGYIVSYVNARRDGDNFSGIRLRVIGPDGRPAITEIELDSTFDIQALAFQWAPFAGGMLVYSRGLQGADGVFAIPIDERLSVQAPVNITSDTAGSVAVRFGDGGWGASWLARGADGSSTLTFALLDENGGVVGIQSALAEGGVGPLAMAYGQGAFAIAWSRILDGGVPKPYLTLLEAGGDVIGTPPVAGPTNMGLAHDISWIGPAGFAVAWLATLEDGRTQAGVTRISAIGVANHPVLIPLEPLAGHRTVKLSGNHGNLGVWVTTDPMPPAVGFSSGSRVQLGRLGVCN
jgi:hypothetical protein